MDGESGSGENDTIVKVTVGVMAGGKGTIDGKKGSYQNPTIPKGYYAINTDTAKWDVEGGPQYNNGLVISDELSNGNEWVWVPVQDVTVMYETANPEINITGGVENIEISDVKTGKYSKSEIISGQGQTRGLPNETSVFCEPSVLMRDGGAFDTIEENYKAAGFNSLANMAQTMVDEYSDMIASIEKYGGFYIGRYELTANGEKPGEVLTNVNWYNLYAKCKTLAKENSNTTTRMIWGNQWDVVCNWIANNGDKKSITDSSSWGNYNTSTGNAAVTGFGSKKDTGFSDYWRANNIYDLAGNCEEWTQECYSGCSRASRGGGYMSGAPGYPVFVPLKENRPLYYVDPGLRYP